MMAHTRATVVQAIEATGVVAVVRLDDARVGLEVAKALAAGGVTCIEITMTVPNAVALIAELSDALDDAIIGAGTVTDARTAQAVIEAGARFVVGPVFRPEIIAACHSHGVAVMPGCFSPTEILSAWELGADIVKVFPATSLGPAYIKDLRGPLPKLRLMPTGGVTRDNAGDWIRAGAVAVGAGTALVDPKAIAARRFEIITENARQFVEAVRAARPDAVVSGTVVSGFSRIDK
jgi:2-dehydro-3-deoxyphosphogluconate aldolase/(4S)-4-hydroxy-2-oxoglutarate aldolase